MRAVAAACNPKNAQDAWCLGCRRMGCAGRSSRTGRAGGTPLHKVGMMLPFHAHKPTHSSPCPAAIGLASRLPVPHRCFARCSSSGRCACHMPPPPGIHPARTNVPALSPDHMLQTGSFRPRPRSSLLGRGRAGGQGNWRAGQQSRGRGHGGARGGAGTATCARAGPWGVGAPILERGASGLGPLRGGR